MTTVTVFTAERMAEIEAQAVIGATVVDGHLIMTRHNGTTFDAGEVGTGGFGGGGGSIEFAKDLETFYIYRETAGPMSLSANVQTPFTGTIMDLNDGDPSWGHWDTATDGYFEIDEAGLYNIHAYCVIDSSGSSTGRSTLHIDGTLGSAENEFTNMSGQDARLIAQLTALYEPGDGIRADVMSTVNALNLTYAEIYIQKFNITSGDGGGGGGGGGGGSGDIVLSINDQEYHRDNDTGSMTLVAYTHKALDEVIMDNEVTSEPAWGHWSDGANGFVIDTTGFYDVYASASLNPGSSVPGRTIIWIEVDDAYAGSQNEYSHQTSIPLRADTQYTALIEAGSLVKAWVNSSHALSITSAELKLRKLDIEFVGTGGGGGIIDLDSLPEIAAANPAEVALTTAGDVTTLTLLPTIARQNAVDVNTLYIAGILAATPMFNRLSSDSTPVNNSTTAIDSGLTVTLAASTHYAIEGCIFYSSSTTAGMSLSISTPGGATTGYWSAFGETTTGTLRSQTVLLTAPTTLGGGGANRLACLPHGMVHTGPTGEFKIRFAQATAEASNTTIEADSWIKLTKVV